MVVIVLDTNVVLDWLLFADPRVTAVAAAITSGRVRWVAATAMRDELAHVLARGIAARPGHATTSIVEAFDRFAVCVEPSAQPAAPSHLRCTDADDQKFVDLALQVGASALLSRDRAVLKLAGRAAPYGLGIHLPERWLA